jgi:hypothetical protein
MERQRTTGALVGRALRARRGSRGRGRVRRWSRQAGSSHVSHYRERDALWFWSGILRTVNGSGLVGARSGPERAAMLRDGVSSWDYGSGKRLTSRRLD